MTDLMTNTLEAAALERRRAEFRRRRAIRVRVQRIGTGMRIAAAEFREVERAAIRSSDAMRRFSAAFPAK